MKGSSELEGQVLREHSKAQTMRLAKWVGGDRKRFAELMKLVLNGEYKVTQRASWIMLECSSTHPSLAEPFVLQMIERAADPSVHPGVARNVTGTLQHISIPHDVLGAVVVYCFNVLVDEKAPLAVRANAMTVLANLCKREPELINEFKTALEMLRTDHSPALRARRRQAERILSKTSEVRQQTSDLRR